jgi:alkanesulfonate monooxygenase SsuD/methylene tetrahydromethanopterin reductase-like flavin-dependent oxidoreductase (luciferase family)
MDYWFSASHEMFPPSDLLEQAQAAAAAGFDGIGCSDHFAPWWPEGQSGNAWVWLGAAGQAVPALPIGTGVTALVHRYHPAVVAQAFMSLQEHAAEQVSDDDLRESFVISTDPEEHVSRIRALEDLGATVVCLQNMSGADPMGTIHTYGEHVLPALRGVRA